LKVSAIAFAVILLIIFGLSTIPTFSMELFGFPIEIANPVNMIGNILLFTLQGFSVTIQNVLLAVMIMLFIVGVIGK
jgi:hypothetical protein